MSQFQSTSIYAKLHAEWGWQERLIRCARRWCVWPTQFIERGGSEFCHSVATCGNSKVVPSLHACNDGLHPKVAGNVVHLPWWALHGASGHDRLHMAALHCITIFVLLGPAHYDHGTSSSCHIDSHCNQPPKCGEWARLLIARDAKRRIFSLRSHDWGISLRRHEKAKVVQKGFAAKAGHPVRPSGTICDGLWPVPLWSSGSKSATDMSQWWTSHNESLDPALYFHSWRS